MSDYTAILRRVPTGLNIEYKREIGKFFEKKGFDVIKVSLVYKLDLLKAAQKKLNDTIIEKQKYIESMQFKEYYTNEELQIINDMNM